MNGPESILIPSFERAFWRTRRIRRFRDFDGFSRKKGHFEPEDHSSRASHFAEELSREESAEEIRQIYENAVVILGNRRSGMERTERTLDCPQLRYAIEAAQDPENPGRVRISRLLWIVMPLDELPPFFDDLFPFPPEELVVPVEGSLDRRAVLEALEDWEQLLGAKLSENTGQTIFRLRLPSGLTLTVDLEERETVFQKEGAAGVLPLGGAVSRELKALGLRRWPDSFSGPDKDR